MVGCAHRFSGVAPRACGYQVCIDRAIGCTATWPALWTAGRVVTLGPTCATASRWTHAHVAANAAQRAHRLISFE